MLNEATFFVKQSSLVTFYKYFENNYKKAYFVLLLVVSLYHNNKQLNKTTMTTQELAVIIEGKIEKVINGSASQYLEFQHPETEESWTIRVSDHNANPQRVDENTISFVIFVPEKEKSSDENYSNWGIAKKEFRNISNQFFLNEEGGFEENFPTMEECLEYVLF